MLDGLEAEIGGARRLADCSGRMRCPPRGVYFFREKGEIRSVFLGGKDYLPLFCNLAAHIRSTPVAFYNSAKSPRAERRHLKRFETTTRTNWHYECANALIGDSITV